MPEAALGRHVMHNLELYGIHLDLAVDREGWHQKTSPRCGTDAEEEPTKGQVLEPLYTSLLECRGL